MRRAATLTLLALAGSALAQGVSSPQPLRIKVVLQTRTSAYMQALSGILVPRRASLEPFMIEEVKAALTDVLAQVEAQTKVKPLLYLTEDSEHAAGVYEEGDLQEGIGDANLGLFGLTNRTKSQRGGKPNLLNRLFIEAGASLINSDPFDAIDGAYRGPYQAVFMIGPGLDGATTAEPLEGSRAWSIGWNTFSRMKPKEAMRDALLARLATLSPELASLKPNEPSLELGAYGEAEVSTKDGVTSVRNRGVIPRGGITLFKLAEGPQKFEGLLRFSVRTSSQEPLAIVLADKAGRPLKTILLKGTAPGLSSLCSVLKSANGSLVQAGTEWTEITLALKDFSSFDQAAFVQVGSPGIPLERGPLEQTAFEVKVNESGSSEALTVSPAEPSDQEREFIAWKSSLEAGWDDAKASKLVENLSSPLSWLRASTLQAAYEKPDSRLIGAIRALAGSGSIGDSYLACRALSAAGSEGQTALADVLKKGPFETNRRFAAEHLKLPLDRAALNMVSVLLVNRGWRTRLAAARILAADGSRESQVALAGTLDFRSEPHPAVRIVIAEAADTAFELSARRLLYAAVNDPIQWVRSAALIRLLECPNSEIRAEAIKGVTDDSPTVRVRLLQAMAAKPSADYRSSLRQAVTDRHATVRAAALFAFAAQAEATTQSEIENTLKDEDEGVQMALVHLAKSGKFKLPSAVAGALKQSPHEEVRKAAETLPAS